MKCPIDGETLVISERSGVEIDYCPKCRGVWLDRGELDKILERSAPTEPVRQERNTRSEYSEQKERYSEEYERKPKRRESFLSDLFDF